MSSKKTKGVAAVAPETPLAWTVRLIGARGVADHACCAEEDVLALVADESAILQGGKRERVMAFVDRQHALTAAHPANLLMALRHRAGLPATTVAAKAGLRAAVINRLEGGHQIPSLETLAKLWAFWRAEIPTLDLHLEDLCLADAFDLAQRVGAALGAREVAA